MFCDRLHAGGITERHKLYMHKFAENSKAAKKQVSEDQKVPYVGGSTLI